MKTIGMLGGMSWESTLSYYSAVNLGVRARLGGFHSAKICMVSVDFAEIESLQVQDRWSEAATLLSIAAKSVEAGGAQGLLMCTNTMHKVADEIQASIGIPMLHIADATAERLQQQGIHRVGLLGTRFTMEQAFYKDRLTRRHGIEVLTPDERDRAVVHDVIYSELVMGRTSEGARNAYLRIIDDLAQRQVQGVILGCTEIALLIQQQHTDVPLFDTTAIHAQKAVDFALS